jgi:RecJ-like exonuclease
MPDRVQANQTLDVGAVLAPRHVGSDLAMSDVNAELLAKDRVCEGCRGGGSITIGGTHVCKSCNGIGYLRERRKSRLQAEAQAQTTAAQAYTRTASSGGPGVDMCWTIGGQTAAQASVLTDAVYAWVREDLSAGAQMQIGFFVQKLIDRLTGTPAPAPTMPTQEQIAEAICDVRLRKEAWLKAKATESDAFIHEARAVIVLFAKGDTP